MLLDNIVLPGNIKEMIGFQENTVRVYLFECNRNHYKKLDKVSIVKT